MFKMFVFLLSVFILSACQTASQVQKASQSGLAGSYSCEQITSTFAAYEQDKTNLTPLLELSKMTGLDLSQTTATLDPSAYYSKAKTSANVVLLMQGCLPI